MQDAGVDFVFLVAQTLAGSATVEAAQTLGYKPQWTTIGNNVTNTVAKFYTNAKDNYDGAYGLDIAFTDLTPAAADCNRSRSPAAPRSSRTDSDGYGFTGVTCIQMQSLAQAIDAVDGTDRPGVGDRRAARRSSRSLMIAGPQGSLSKDKHDAGTCGVPVPRTRRPPSSSNRSTTEADQGRRLSAGGRLGERARSAGSRTRRRRRARGGGARGGDPADRSASVVPEVLLADAELPGVGDDAMSLREALRLGGARTITIIGLLGALAADGRRRLQRARPRHPEVARTSPTPCSARSAARPACCSSSAPSRCRRCRTACRASSSSPSRCRSGR